jgi:outer membrane immunogenic protein
MQAGRGKSVGSQFQEFVEMKFAFACSAAVLGTLALSNPSAAQDYPAIWTGFYAGASAGYGEVLDEPGAFDVSGGLLGMHLGYNYQIGSTMLGVEGDYTGSWMEDGFLDVDYLASIRARAGYSFGNALLYGTLGYAWADATTFGGSGDFDGLVLGGGLEYKFADSWSARVEGLQYWLEPSSGALDDLDVGVVRAGLTWHLN